MKNSVPNHSRRISNKCDTVGKSTDDSFVLFKCKSCGVLEDIPKEVVDFFDLMDGGDPLVPPRFDCQKCSGDLHPTFYVNHDGIVYNL